MNLFTVFIPLSIIYYFCKITDSIFQCVFTVYSVVWSLNLSLVVLFIYCKISLQWCNESKLCLTFIAAFYCNCTFPFMLYTVTDIDYQQDSYFPKGGFGKKVLD